MASKRYANQSSSTLQRREFGHSLRKDFLFDEDWINLNHGSFGTYPRPVRDVLHRVQSAAEARPDPFMRYTYPILLDASRSAIAALLNAPDSECVFVPNATTGVNTVLRNLVYAPGDVIIYFATIYSACEKSVQYVVETTAVESHRIAFQHPVSDSWLIETLCSTIQGIRQKGKNPCLAIFDTVVSMPGVRMPFEKLAGVCKDQGVLSLVDGAHGAGMLGSELDLGKLGADFFVTNCHKWLFVPRGCALFHVPIRNQHLIRSTVPTSHGFVPQPTPGGTPLVMNPLPLGNKSPFVTNFQFVGTADNSPYLCIPAAIAYRRDVLGGEDAIRTYCFDLAKRAGETVSCILGTEVLENNEGTLGQCCFANVRLPIDAAQILQIANRHVAAVQDVEAMRVQVRNWISMTLIEDHGMFIATMWYGDAWWARLSSQVYLQIEDFEKAAHVLQLVCDRVESGEVFAEVAKL